MNSGNQLVCDGYEFFFSTTIGVNNFEPNWVKFKVERNGRMWADFGTLNGDLETFLTKHKLVDHDFKKPENILTFN